MWRQSLSLLCCYNLEQHLAPNRRQCGTDSKCMDWREEQVSFRAGAKARGPGTFFQVRCGTFTCGDISHAPPQLASSPSSDNSGPQVPILILSDPNLSQSACHLPLASGSERAHDPSQSGRMHPSFSRAVGKDAFFLLPLNLTRYKTAVTGAPWMPRRTSEWSQHAEESQEAERI